MKNLISVPKPCNEDWNAMTPEGVGKFCNVCTKTVADFTGMTAVEIKAYILANKNRIVCGRFNNNQLDIISINIPEKVLYNQIQFRKIFMLALLITMGSMLLSCNGKKVKGEVISSDPRWKDSITIPPLPLKDVKSSTIGIVSYVQDTVPSPEKPMENVSIDSVPAFVKQVLAPKNIVDEVRIKHPSKNN